MMGQLSDKTFRERIKHTIRFFDAFVEDEKHQFDLGIWTVQGFDEGHCLMTACAGGWMIRNPWFRRRGLVDDPNYWGVPFYRSRSGFAAMAAFLGLDHYTTHKVFGNVSLIPRTRLDVIQELRYVLRDRNYGSRREGCS